MKTRGSTEIRTWLPKPQAATIIVSAANSLHPERADMHCDGVNDHVEIQAALDALPATGGKVKLLDGTYNCEVTINLDSNQTLRGCGRNTILATSTADLIFLSAVGGAMTEKTGIVIADLQIDGGAGLVSDCGIYFEYVDYSLIQNVYARRMGSGVFWSGIVLENSDLNQVIGNICQGNDWGIYLENSDSNQIIDSICQENYEGIRLDSSSNNTIIANTCQENGDFGIYLDSSSNNTIIANTCQGNISGIYLYEADSNTVSGNTFQGNDGIGIYLYMANSNVVSVNTCQGNSGDAIYINSANSNTVLGNTCQGNDGAGISLVMANNNVISGNTCQGNTGIGIYVYEADSNTVSGNTFQGNDGDGIVLLQSSNNAIVGNTLTENSQVTDNLRSDITLDNLCNYNNIQSNTCRAGALLNKPRFGIFIATANCNKNVVANNDLYDDGFGTAPFIDIGTLTHVEDNNRGITINQIKMFRLMKNTSGVQRVAGDVVSLNAVAAGNEVTTPAAIGERQVYGMVAETIANNAWGLVQVKGKTIVLKSTNAGGGDIVIGDFLITENGVRARKAAAATDPIFARALEACSAADCTIDAYIMSPWE